MTIDRTTNHVVCPTLSHIRHEVSYSMGRTLFQCELKTAEAVPEQRNTAKERSTGRLCSWRSSIGFVIGHCHWCGDVYNVTVTDRSPRPPHRRPSCESRPWLYPFSTSVLPQDCPSSGFPVAGHESVHLAVASRYCRSSFQRDRRDRVNPAPCVVDVYCPFECGQHTPRIITYSTFHTNSLSILRREPVFIITNLHWSFTYLFLRLANVFTESWQRLTRATGPNLPSKTTDVPPAPPRLSASLHEHPSHNRPRRYAIGTSSRTPNAFDCEPPALAESR